MLDANSAYTLKDVGLFKRIDPTKPTMIEQPLAHDDLVDHAALQRQIATAVCLDESIHTGEDARKAIEIGATRVINIKAGRVGGLASASASTMSARRARSGCAADARVVLPRGERIRPLRTSRCRRRFRLSAYFATSSSRAFTRQRAEQ